MCLLFVWCVWYEFCVCCVFVAFACVFGVCMFVVNLVSVFCECGVYVV